MCSFIYSHLFTTVRRRNEKLFLPFFFVFNRTNIRKEKKVKCFSLSIEIAVWRWLFGWRWFFKILIKFIVHVCAPAPHIMAVVFHIFACYGDGTWGRRKTAFSGIFNKEWGKFMLWKIIKNNYRNEKNMFSHRPTSTSNTSWQY